jgi:hypothetical protein
MYTTRHTHSQIDSQTDKSNQQSSPLFLPSAGLFLSLSPSSRAQGRNSAVTRKRRLGGSTSTSPKYDDDDDGAGCTCTATFVSPTLSDCALKTARTGHEDEDDEEEDEDEDEDEDAAAVADSVVMAVDTGSVAWQRRAVPGLSSSFRVHCRSGGAHVRPWDGEAERGCWFGVGGWMGVDGVAWLDGCAHIYWVYLFTRTTDLAEFEAWNAEVQGEGGAYQGHEEGGVDDHLRRIGGGVRVCVSV